MSHEVARPARAFIQGVLSTGETALVEWNDGFSLVAYGLEPASYTALTVARWCELTGLGMTPPRVG